MCGGVGRGPYSLCDDAALIDAPAMTEAVLRHVHGKQEHTSDERGEK